MAKIHLDYYSGEDKYSDGCIEDELLNNFDKSDEINPESFICKNDSILKFYHLSKIRWGLLYWYDFKPESVVIEVGGGCGALTEMLCQKCHKVITIEMSKRRAEIIYKRCKKYENLDIYVSDLDSLPNTLMADYIVVVGVLEYQGLYGKGNNPYLNFLKNITAHLNVDGRLLLAIENRLGIKYFAGAPEDHYQETYVGIQNYKIKGKARTFTKSDLKYLFEQSGLTNTFFYYPMPDYRIAMEIFSDDYLPKMELGLRTVPYYGEYCRSLLFDERIVYKDLFKNGVFDVFANSFLVDAGRNENRYCKVIYAKNSFDRTSSNRVCTKILSEGVVLKKAISQEAKKNLLNCKINSEKINKRSCNILRAVPVTVDDDIAKMSLINEDSLLSRLIDAIYQHDYTNVENLFDLYYSALLESSDICSVSYRYGPILKELYIEFTLSNCFLNSDNKVIVFDLEKTKEKMPANFMVFRSIENLEGLCTLYGYEYDFQSIKERYKLSKDLWDEYQELLGKYYKEIFEEEIIEPLKKTQNNNVEVFYYNNIILSGRGVEKFPDVIYGRKIYEDIYRNRGLDEYRRKYLSLLGDFFGKEHDLSSITTIAWGAGQCFMRNAYIFKIISQLELVCDVDSSKWNKDMGYGIKGASPEIIKEIKNLFVIIMVIDSQNSMKIKKRLYDMGEIKCINIVDVLRIIY